MSAKGPPPSSFRNNVLQASNATPSSSTDSKLATPSKSAGPRPLHLTLGSVYPTSPSPTTDFIHDSNDSDIVSAASPDFSRPLTSPKGTPTVAKFRKDAASRKRSSISYLPSNPNSPSYLQTNRFDAGDGLNIALSPLSSSHNRTTFLANGVKSPGSGLGRTNSLGGRASRTPKSVGERSSTGSMLNSNTANGVEHLKERPPATLSEKHADLLHFIAQKESKCLELRSQLAVHEAELLQLKKKWERIVNRGFERSLSPSSASTTPTYFLSSSPSHSVSILPESSPGPSSNTAAGTVVLEGLKEGVQGMSRLIAAGLGSITQANPSPPTNEQLSKSPKTPETSIVPLPLRLGTTSQRSAYNGNSGGSGHGQKESQSSSSTNASHATSLSFISASSATSATSAGSNSELTAETARDLSTVESGASGAEAESEFGDFEDGQNSVSRTRSSTLTDHLMVQDTGATPMMSPNPHFGRHKFRGTSRATTDSSASSAKGQLQQEVDSLDDFDWGDGWDEAIGEAQVADQSTSGSSKTKPVPASLDLHSVSSPSSESEARLPSPSAPLRELAMMDSAPSTPASQHMSSWVGTVGKKWGEIKGSSAFTKNSKRASVLLSDIQQSLVGSLISPTPNTPPSAYSTPNIPASSPVFSSNAGRTTAPVKPGMQLPKARLGASLLDDSDDESFGEGGEDANATIRTALPSKMSAPVLVPDSVSKTTAKAKSETALQPVADEDDWNW